MCNDRPITEKDIQVDARCCFPRGYHPTEIDREPDGRTPACALPLLGKPIKYYLVNFDEAVRVTSGDPSLHVTDTASRDLFAADIHALGTIYHRRFTGWVCVSQYSTLFWYRSHMLQCEPMRPLVPLVALMRHDDAGLRPTAAEALDMFKGIWRACFRDNYHDPLRWQWWQVNPRRQ